MRLDITRFDMNVDILNKYDISRIYSVHTVYLIHNQHTLDTPHPDSANGFSLNWCVADQVIALDICISYHLLFCDLFLFNP